MSNKVEISEICARLQSNDPSEALKAMETIAKTPLTRDLIDILISNLDHVVWKIRKLSAAKLEKEINVAFPQLIQNLSSQNHNIRYWSLHVLPAAGKKATSYLIEKYQDFSHEEKIFTLKALNRIKDPTCIPFILNILNTTHWSLRNEAANVLYAMKNESVPHLREAIREGSDDQRYWSFILLGRILRQKAIPTFSAILKSTDYDEKVRSYALSGLKETDTKDTIPLLIETLDSELWSLRAQAARTLIQHHNEPHSELIKAATKGNKTIRYWVYQVLKEIVKEKHLSLFEPWLVSSDNELRYLAIGLLGNVRSLSAVEILLRHFHEPQWYLRKHAAESLITIGSISIKPVLGILSAADEEELFWLCRVLGSLGHPSALTGLEKLLSHETKDVRLYALEAIARIPDEQSIKILISAFDNEFWVIRSQAAEYLLEKGPEPFMSLFEALLSDSESVKFWAAKTIEESSFFGAKYIQKQISDGLKREGAEMVTHLSRLNRETFLELISHSNLRKSDIFEKLSHPSCLDSSALYDFSRISANPIGNIHLRMKNPALTEELKSLLKEAVELGATQLHLRINTRPLARVNGILCKCGDRPFSSEEIQGFFADYVSEEHLTQLNRDKVINLTIPFDSSRCFRVHLMQQTNGFEAVLHVSSNTIPGFSELNLPVEFLEHISKLSHGLILISGASNSGKSTTVLSMLSHINRNFVKNIITIEDSLEFPLQNAKSIISQKLCSRDIPNYEDAVHALLKEDADVVYMARVPDFPVLETLLHMANSRFLLILETNASSSREALEKILNLFPEKHIRIYEKLFQSSLQASLHLKLLNNAQQTGILPAVEYFLCNARISQNLSLTRMSQLKSILQNSKSDFAVSLDDYLLKLASEQKITYQEALRWLEDKSKISMDDMW